MCISLTFLGRIIRLDLDNEAISSAKCSLDFSSQPFLVAFEEDCTTLASDMPSEYHSTPHNYTNRNSDLQDTTFWPNASWATEQLDYQTLSNCDSGMPRSVQRDLAEIDLALANDGGFGPSVGAGTLQFWSLILTSAGNETFG